MQGHQTGIKQQLGPMLLPGKWLNKCFVTLMFIALFCLKMSPSKGLSKNEYLPSPVKLLKRKASEMTCWMNNQLSILSMQIEVEALHLPLDSRKAQWKTWYMHPFPLAILFLWKDDSYITVSQKCEANTWQPSSISCSSIEKRKSGILQTSQNSLYFPCCLCFLSCYPLKAQYDPQTHQTHFVVIFNIKYPFRDYLMLLSVYSLLRLHGSH